MQTQDAEPPWDYWADRHEEYPLTDQMGKMHDESAPEINNLQSKFPTVTGMNDAVPENGMPEHRPKKMIAVPGEQAVRDRAPEHPEASASRA